MRYDYYQVDIPEDVGDKEQRLDLAMDEAKERANLWVVPCEWTAWIINSQYVRVRRMRRDSKK